MQNKGWQLSALHDIDCFESEVVVAFVLLAVAGVLGVQTSITDGLAMHALRFPLPLCLSSEPATPAPIAAMPA